MARKVKVDNQIICSGGSTYLTALSLNATYKNRWYWFHVNPKLLFPAFRTYNRKVIFVNGKRRGYAEMRSGLIPLSRYVIPGKGLRISLLNFVRKYIGVSTKTYERGYMFVAIKGYSYAVTQHYTADGLLFCEVFDLRTEDQIGSLTFNTDFSEVVPRTTRAGVTHTLHVIAGFVVDSLIYSQVATALTKTIKVYV